MGLLKPILIFLGTFTLCIGVVGVFIPGLPTTPFLLLSAGLYLKSSDRLYDRLISNRFVGSYIKDFKIKKGMSVKSKLYSISMMWLMISISCFLFITPLLIELIVITLGIIGTMIMGFIIPTRKNSDKRQL
jgi:uncharacterized membrane protein YbaN (DUF454 family)